MTAIKKILITGVTIWAALVVPGNRLLAQTATSKKCVVVDVSHGQRFYNDPVNMSKKDSAFTERVKYMTGEIVKNANSLGAAVRYQNTAITQGDLAKCNLLFIHIPSSKFSPEEVKAIHQYLQGGGSLFMVMDTDHWSTLAQVNANDIVSPFGIVYKGDNPDGSSGGYTNAGVITDKHLAIPYHGARIVEGGAPFCFSNQTKDNPFGIYKQIKNGGKIIAMGDGMVSLYMTKWEGVDNYQCSAFMHDAFAWLLK